MSNSRVKEELDQSLFSCVKITGGAWVNVLPLATTPGHLVRRAQQVHTSLWTQHLGGDLTGPQYALLVAVDVEGHADQTRISELASLDKNTAADVVRRLVERGWIERSLDDRDKRRKVLSLTAPARIAVRRLTPSVLEVQADLLGPLADSDRVRTTELLARVAFSTARQDGHLARRPAAPNSEDEVIELLSRIPGHLLRRVQQVHNIMWARHVGTELTGPQYAILVTLAVEPNVSRAVICARASLDKSSTADVVSRLRRNGCIGDGAPAGRRQTLALARPAAELLNRLAPAVAAVQSDLFAALRDSERVELTSFLGRIADGGEPPRPSWADKPST